MNNSLVVYSIFEVQYSSIQYMYMYFTHHVQCSQWMVVCKHNNVMYQEPMKKKEGEDVHNSHAINN